MNYIYGTWQVLRGLRALNLDMNQPWLLKARAGSKVCSTPTAAGANAATLTTIRSSKVKDRAPASQTAWAVMGLCAFGDPNRPSVQRGIEYLIRTQNADGSWTEEETTGTGFPKVFYLKYDMYRNAWPLLALATYRQLLQGRGPGASETNGHVPATCISTFTGAVTAPARSPVTR